MSLSENVKKELGPAFVRFCETIACLRDPQTGCPWDLKQDHKSLRRYMIEEAYEAVNAMASGDSKTICEELGDVLLQVVLNAQVATDSNQFTIGNVVEAIEQKMRRRHPHVFESKSDVDTPEKVREQWKKIKAKEKKPMSTHELLGQVKECVTSCYPSTRQAYEIGKLSRKVNFDWQSAKAVFEKLESELDELRRALEVGDYAPTSEVYSELGDLYFSAAQLCRHLGLDPEMVAIDGNRKFVGRFRQLAKQAKREGVDLMSATPSQMESLWGQVKQQER